MNESHLSADMFLPSHWESQTRHQVASRTYRTMHTATYDIYVAGAAKDLGGPGSQSSRGPPPMGGRRPGGRPIGDSPPEYGRLKVCAPLRLTNGPE